MLMAQTVGAWTLYQLDRLPDDGNRYELLDGELFVTPAPVPAHEMLAEKLRDILDPYVKTNQLGRCFSSNAAVRTNESELLPDLSVRQSPKIPPATWAEMPLPKLVVEVLSPTTHRRDHEHKREFYLRIGIPEYWIVDGKQRTIRIVKLHANDVVADHKLTWHPTEANAPLVIDIAKYFNDALGVDSLQLDADE